MNNTKMQYVTLKQAVIKSLNHHQALTSATKACWLLTQNHNTLASLKSSKSSR